MKLSVISFTKRGMLLSKRLAEALETDEIVLYKIINGKLVTKRGYKIE